jgi:hypothetical protein
MLAETERNGTGRQQIGRVFADFCSASHLPISEQRARDEEAIDDGE